MFFDLDVTLKKNGFDVVWMFFDLDVTLKKKKIFHKTLEVIYYNKDLYSGISLQSNSASMN